MKRLLTALLILATAAGCSKTDGTGLRTAHGASTLAPTVVTSGTGTISGVVTDGTNSNAPVAGALVTAVSFIESGGYIFGEVTKVRHAVTDANGSYTLTGIADGSFVVMCRPALTSPDDSRNAVFPLLPIQPRYTTLVPQWHSGDELTGAAGKQAALNQPLVISGGNSISGVNFVLHRNAAEASGVVSHEFSHLGAAGMHILASINFGDGLPVTVATSEALVNSTGNFRIAGLPASSEVREEDVENQDPTLPGLDQVSVHENGVFFAGDHMVSGIRAELHPYAKGPGIIGGGGNSTQIGSTVDDPQDADLGAADVTRVSVSQLTDDSKPHLTGCVGFSMHSPATFRVDVYTDSPLSTQAMYRLRVLLTDNLSLTNYTQKQIQTTITDVGTVEGGFHGVMGGYDGDSPGRLIDPGVRPLNLVPVGPYSSEFGFKTTGPALGTDPDPTGDFVEPGVSKLSWILRLPDLGTLSGGGTGFYLYVETIGVKGGGGKQDTAPDGGAAAPLFVPFPPAGFGESVCGKTGVI